MSDVPSVLKKLQIEGTRYGSAVSESLVQTISGVVNKFVDIISNPTSHNVMGQPSVIHIQTGYGIFSDSTTYTVPSGSYALLTTVPRNNSEIAWFGPITGGVMPGGVSFPEVMSGGGGIGSPPTRMWLIPGETVGLHSAAGHGGDHWIYLFPTVAIHDYPTS